MKGFPVMVLKLAAFALPGVLYAACGSAVPSSKAASCTAQYTACVNPDIEAYRACRARVDAACLSTDGGAP